MSGDARDFNNMEARVFIKFTPPSPLQGKAPKEIHAILTETLGEQCITVCHRQKLGGSL